MRNLPSSLAMINVDEESWHIVQNVRTIGRSLSGQETLVQTPASRWTAKLDLSCRYEDGRYWRTWLARHQGGIVPDMFGPSGDHILMSGVENNNPGNNVVVELAADVAVGSVSISIVEPASLVVLVGQFVSFNGRMHLVRKVSDAASGNVALGIWPPVRAAMLTGVESDPKPRCRMRLLDAEGGDIPYGYTDTYIRWSVHLVETPPGVSYSTEYDTIESLYP